MSVQVPGDDDDGCSSRMCLDPFVDLVTERHFLQERFELICYPKDAGLETCEIVKKITPRLERKTFTHVRENFKTDELTRDGDIDRDQNESRSVWGRAAWEQQQRRKQVGQMFGRRIPHRCAREADRAHQSNRPEIP